MPRLHGLLLLPVLGLMSCAPFEAWFDYGATDEKLQFIGRMQLPDDEGPRYTYPGATVRFRCNCTGVDVAFQDEAVRTDDKDEKHLNFINVIVDGEHRATIQLQPKASLLPGVRGLSRGEHLIELVKRTGPYAGNIRFLGVSLQGSLLDPPPLPERRIEVIGDTITCGYGDEASILAPTNTEPNTGYHARNEDNSKAYGSLVGRRFNAQVVTTCMANRGIQRNPMGDTDDTLPTRYARIFPDNNRAEVAWNPQKYVPDLIIANLGTPDFAVVDDQKLPTAPDPDLFKAAYTRFLKQLRAYYPSARIICTVGPTLNDFYPKERKLWTTFQRDVSETVQALGDPNVFFYAHSAITSDPYGEDWHPTAQVHERMAEELADVIEHRTGLGW